MISVLSVFPPFRGGIANFSDYLYKNLRKHTSVSAFNFSYLYPPVLFPGKSQFSDHLQDKYAKPVLHSCNPFNWKQAAQHILESNPNDVVICYWHPFFAPAFLKVIRTIRKKKPDTRIHILAHNVIPHERFPFGHSLSRKLLNAADTLVVLSQKSFSEAIKLDIKTDIKLLFHPVYEQELPNKPPNILKKEYGIKQDEHVFLFFGLVRHYKGLDLFIEALNKINLAKHKIRPLIVGEFYTDKEPILSQIKAEHRDLYIIKDEFVSEEEMARVFTVSDALVMPYRSASQSGILANAINFYLPTIVTNLEGLTEHISHGESALIVQKNDTQKLKKAILELTQIEVRDHIKQSLPTLKESLSWDMFTKRFIDKISKENL